MKRQNHKKTGPYQISKNQCLEFLEQMLTIRYFEEQVDKFYMEGKVHGTGHLYIGMEAVAVGTILALDKKDVITSNHRGHGHCIAKGADIRLMMAELLGKATGYCKGKGGSMHIADIGLGNLGANGIVGGGIAIATGAALAIKQKKTGQIVICFFGDGATNQGVFHESVNMASIWDLPVLYVIENNKYGMGFPVEKAVNIEKLSDRACAYGLEGHTIDGNDVIGVYNTSKRLIEKVRKTGKPIILECLTYRWKGHSRMDAERYRTKEEVKEWMGRCPIKVFKKYLSENNIASESEIRAIEDRVRLALEKAKEFALESPYPKKTEATEDVYAPIS